MAPPNPMTPETSTKIKTIMYCEGNTDGTVGGSFFSLLYLVKGLNKSKYRPIVIFHKDHSLMDEYTKAGIETIIIARPASTILRFRDESPLKVFNYPLKFVQKAINLSKFLPLTIYRYRRLIIEKNVDLLHLNNSVAANHDWMFAALLSNIKCITHERAIYSEYPRLSRFLSSHLDKIICISEAVRHNLTKCGIDAKNIVIYNGIDPQTVKADVLATDIRHKHQIDENMVTIGVVGNIKSWKGQQSIISALSIIIAKHSNVVCMLIGDTSENDISYRQGLDEIISKFELENHVVFTGYRKNVFDYINALDIMIHTSIEPEPFGRVLIEAMAMKRPLIGARAGAVPEIILNKETGLTFEPLDVQDLANSVLFLLDHPEQALKMAEAGYRRLHECFLISENTRMTEEVYDSLLK